MGASEQPWVWYGGRPSLDFVNTRRDREASEASEAEYLLAPGDLAAWLRAAGLATGHIAVDAALFADAIELREAIDAAVTATVTGRPFPAEALRVLNGWLAAAPGRPPALRIAGGVAVVHPEASAGDARHALRQIALDAAQLLGTDQRSRLRICPGRGCGGRFLDDSPARRRRWCSMAVCGNRSKATAHRRAARTSQPG